jgi:hypothetical protein
LILGRHQYLFGGIALLATCLACPRLPAQNSNEAEGTTKRRLSLDTERKPPRRGPRQTATIHWQSVPLGDAIGRLKPLFDETVFVDRRVDPSLRVSLDIDASSAEQVVVALAEENELGVGRLGKLIYLGPNASAEQLKSLATLRAKEVAKLPAELRTPLAGKQRLSWPRLSEPRQLVTSAVQRSGWRVGEAERIPHDLWAAGELPELSLAEQLTLLLIGFDLTFELRPNERSIEIVPLAVPVGVQGRSGVRSRSGAKPNAARTARGTRQVYTLRVQEQPVGAVLRELSKRLHWAIQIDEDAIRAAGISLDKRVSFSVDQVDRDKLLDALLTPAGLDYRIEGEQIRVIPRRYADK